MNQIRASAPVSGLWRGGLDFEDDLEACEDAVVYPIATRSKLQTPDIPKLGESILYFGCRRENQDYLFKDELNNFVRCELLTKLRVAFSRQEPSKYVQDLIEEDGADLARKILEQGAFVYICGDGTNMARDVLSAFTRVLIKHSSPNDEIPDEKSAVAYLVEMQKRGRYVQDIW